MKREKSMIRPSNTLISTILIATKSYFKLIKVRKPGNQGPTKAR